MVKIGCAARLGAVYPSENGENVMGCWGVGWLPPVKIVNMVKIVKIRWAALVCGLCTPNENGQNGENSENDIG